MIFLLISACAPDNKEDFTDTGSDVTENWTEYECESPLKILFEDEDLIGGEPLNFGSSPAYGDPTDLELILENTCPKTLSFLGNPDEWIEGSQFEILKYPPVMLEQGEKTELSIRHRPGAHQLQVKCIDNSTVSKELARVSSR